MEKKLVFSNLTLKPASLEDVSSRSMPLRFLLHDGSIRRLPVGNFAIGRAPCVVSQNAVWGELGWIVGGKGCSRQLCLLTQSIGANFRIACNPGLRRFLISTMRLRLQFWIVANVPACVVWLPKVAVIDWSPFARLDGTTTLN